MIRKALAAFAVALVLPFTFAGTAEATRPGPVVADQCTNIAGNQQPYQLVGITAQYRFNTATADPNDCIVINRNKGKK